MIDQRTPLPRPVVEKLPASAKKPVRRVNHQQYKSPAYGETKTSRQTVPTEFDNVRRNENDARLISRMHPSQRDRFLKRVAARQHV